MRWLRASGCALLIAAASPVLAQPADLPLAPADNSALPQGVAVARTADGAIYVDGKGRTLYGMDMRTVLREAPDPAQYCAAQCQAEWEPFLAPAGAKVNIRYPRGFDRPPPTSAQGASAGPAVPPSEPAYLDNRRAPDWTVIAGPRGPQWLYKGWHMVFVHKGDPPRSTALDGSGQFTWNVLKYIPPRPVITAPPGIKPTYSGGRYVLTDDGGHVLFTGKCTVDCAGWRPLDAPEASLGIGKWTVGRQNGAGQWFYRSAPVFATSDDSPETVPAGGKAVLP